MTNTRLLIGGLAIALLAVGCGGSKEDAAGHATAATAQSSAGLPDGNIAAGEKLATTKLQATGQACVECHGPDGAAPIDGSYPVLAGQYADYVAHSLQMYRDGRRGNALMQSQAKVLTDQQIADLGAFFASRKRSIHDLSEQVSN